MLSTGNGGTGAGRLMGRKKNQLKEPWKCSCGKSVDYYWQNCPSCGAVRQGRN